MRANHLRPEKQAFDIAKSALGKADVALRQAKMELTEAQEQFDKNQADFDDKDEAYQIEKAVPRRAKNRGVQGHRKI